MVDYRLDSIIKSSKCGPFHKSKLMVQVIKVRAIFGFAEWLNICSSSKHCEKVKTNDLNKTTIK